eukprot:CAMPEP_0201513686 /NCGR_PEP_ID=MMETSP0161_2-20130828/5689_1 /ASSEMBLY_ACC=CAM_ASM_000251 /TAXON_ID=180227 /ORGANISM="Neoparamoeba aestuarina, Strain SoJaBio B1-5/56/2" /LENGTH=538 /DNA_ID=CAMNT_0047909993 /DNA_START=41 /DNA_END=1655 /DNA_ORIENTATION=-
MDCSEAEKYERMDHPDTLPLGQQKMGMLLGVVFGLVLCAIFLGIYLPLTRDDDSDKNQWMAPDVQEYVDYISTDRIMAHLKALQKIANANGNTRAVGTPGYEQSRDYVVAQLRMFADCDPEVQQFIYENYQLLAEPELSSATTEFEYNNDFSILQYSGSGDVSAITVSLADGEDGCSLSAWDNYPQIDGAIANIPRGSCTFFEKAESAFNAGAVGVLIYNSGDGEDNTGLFGGTLAKMTAGPVFSLTYALGREFAESPQVLTMKAETDLVQTTTWNVICEGNEGDKDSTIVVGSHLDSVPAGPGINDNGSGSAANLEMAIQLAGSSLTPVNRVTFAWWGAEEVGLKGSEHWVAHAKETGELPNVACNLNYDMIGSPNAFNGVYDGANAELEDVRNGSATIQAVYEKFFNEENIPFGLTPFTGRSDYGPFIYEGYPAGGLFTGAEEFKTLEERAKFGGLANSDYDACYHQYCDTVENVDQTALIENAKAAAYAVGYLGTKKNLESILVRKQQKKEETENLFPTSTHLDKKKEETENLFP